MKIYVNLSLASIFLCFTGCVTTSKIKNSQKSIVQYNNSARTENKSVQNRAVVKRPTKTAKKLKQKPKVNIAKPIPTKPQEVERVCFDKEGKAHNCNYKIPKPY